MHGCYWHGVCHDEPRLTGGFWRNVFWKFIGGIWKFLLMAFLRNFLVHILVAATLRCGFHLKWVIRWRGSECLSRNAKRHSSWWKQMALFSSSNGDLSRISQPCGLWDFVMKFALCKLHVIYVSYIDNRIPCIIGEQKHRVFPLRPPHQLSPMQTWRPTLKRWKIADPKHYNLKHSDPTCLIEHSSCHSSVIDVRENIWHK